MTLAHQHAEAGFDARQPAKQRAKTSARARDREASRGSLPSRVPDSERGSETSMPAGGAEVRPSAIRRAMEDRSVGRPLEAALRDELASERGWDFSGVRVHTDDVAAGLADGVHADAFTRGRDIYFGTGHEPGTEIGRQLLRHELAHVAQQARGEVSAYAGGVVPHQHPSEASAVSGAALIGPALSSNGPGVTIQRQPTGRTSVATGSLPIGQPEDEYSISGGHYSTEERQKAAKDPAGLILTSSVVGRLETKLASKGAFSISIGKELTRFEGGALGEWVTAYNDFTEYLQAVLGSIGRLRDLLSAGAPAYPPDMTPAQVRSLRPTDDTPETAFKKTAYQDWRDQQARFVTTRDGVPAGLVEKVVERTHRRDDARQEFWEAKGKLERGLAAAKSLDRPKYEGAELSLATLLALATAVVQPELLPVLAAGAAAGDSALEAGKKRKEYEAQLLRFSELLKNATKEVQDDLAAFTRSSRTFWDAVIDHRQAADERDKARIESRRRAATLGQAIAPTGTRDNATLSKIRMPLLVADAWHELAVVGPAAAQKLRKVLAGRRLVEDASIKHPEWRQRYTDIWWVRQAYAMAYSWRPVLNDEDVQDWVAANQEWEEVLAKRDV
jgi:hypothetical protein